MLSLPTNASHEGEIVSAPPQEHRAQVLLGLRLFDNFFS